MNRLRLSLVVLACAVACASLPLKQRAVVSLQASETALEGAHDLERSLCFVSPSTESGGHCTNPQAATVKLSDATHQKMAAVFAQAFAAEVKGAVALQAWQAGQPAPTDVATYQADIQAILVAAQALDPSAKPFLDKVQSAVDSGAAVLTALGVK